MSKQKLNTAAIIVVATILVAWSPALLLAFLSHKFSALLLPVMGFVPYPMQSGQESYSEQDVYKAGATFLIMYAGLGFVAWRSRSVLWAVIFAVLIFLSEATIILRVASFFGPGQGWA